MAEIKQDIREATIQRAIGNLAPFYGVKTKEDFYLAAIAGVPNSPESEEDEEKSVFPETKELAVSLSNVLDGGLYISEAVKSFDTASLGSAVDSVRKNIQDSFLIVGGMPYALRATDDAEIYSENDPMGMLHPQVDFTGEFSEDKTDTNTKPGMLPVTGLGLNQSKNGIPTKVEPNLAVVQVRPAALNLSVRDTGVTDIFMNAIPTIEWSRAMAYFNVSVVVGDLGGFDPNSNQTAQGGLNRFLLGSETTGNPTSQIAQYMRDSIREDQAAVDPAGNLRAYVDMSTFTSPQTLNTAGETYFHYDQYGPGGAALFNDRAAGGTPRDAPVLDRMRPLCSLKDLSISVRNTNGMMSTKTAKLKLTLHDRSRLGEIADLIRPATFGKNELLVEYGWSHPDGKIDDAHGYSDFGKIIDSLRVREKFKVANTNYSFTDDGQVDISLDLISKGSQQFDITDIALSPAVQSSWRAVEDIIKAIQVLRRKAFPGKQMKDVAGVSTIASISRTNVKEILSGETLKEINAFIKSANTSDDATPTTKELAKSLESVATMMEQFETSLQKIIDTKIAEFKLGNDPFLLPRILKTDYTYKRGFKPSGPVDVTSVVTPNPELRAKIRESLGVKATDNHLTSKHFNRRSAKAAAENKRARALDLAVQKKEATEEGDGFVANQTALTQLEGFISKELRADLTEVTKQRDSLKRQSTYARGTIGFQQDLFTAVSKVFGEDAAKTFFDRAPGSGGWSYTNTDIYGDFKGHAGLDELGKTIDELRFYGQILAFISIQSEESIHAIAKGTAATPSATASSTYAYTNLSPRGAAYNQEQKWDAQGYGQSGGTVKEESYPVAYGDGKTYRETRYIVQRGGTAGTLPAGAGTAWVDLVGAGPYKGNHGKLMDAYAALDGPQAQRQRAEASAHMAEIAKYKLNHNGPHTAMWRYGANHWYNMLGGETYLKAIFTSARGRLPGDVAKLVEGDVATAFAAADDGDWSTLVPLMDEFIGIKSDIANLKSMAAEAKLNARADVKGAMDLTVWGKYNYVSLGKIFSSFVGAPICSTNQFNEVQMFFYCFNDRASWMYSQNISSMPINIKTFQRWLSVYREKHANISIRSFLSFMNLTFVSNVAAEAYGFGNYDWDPETLRGRVKQKHRSAEFAVFGKTKIPKGMDNPAVDAVSLASGRDATLKKAYADTDSDQNIVFKRPSIAMYAECIPHRTDPAATILRLHFYDRGATKYSGIHQMLQMAKTNQIGAVKAGFLKRAEMPPDPHTPEATAAILDANRHDIQYKKAMDYAIKSGLIKSVERGDGTPADKVFVMNSSVDALKYYIKTNMPNIIIGSPCSAVISANASSLHNSKNASIHMIRHHREQSKGKTKVAGATDTGIPLRMSPMQVTLDTFGNPLFHIGQQFFIDFGTNTTIDDIYGVVAVEHSVADGQFKSTLKLIKLEAYGQYESMLQVVNKAHVQLFGEEYQSIPGAKVADEMGEIADSPRNKEEAGIDTEE